MFVPRFIEGFSADDEDAQIVWEDIDESGTTLDSSTLIVSAED